MLTRLKQKYKALEEGFSVVQGKWDMPKDEAAKRRVTKESAMRLTPLLRSCNTVAKSKVREDQFKNVCDYFDILGLWSRSVNSPVSAPEAYVSSGRDSVYRGPCSESGGGWGQTEKQVNYS